MSWRTNNFTLFLRGVGRTLGLNAFFMTIFGPKSYEEKFTKALLSHVKQEDCVWDIGANIGHYTIILADIVGSQGKVFAFEPSPKNFRKLFENMRLLKNVVLVPYGLGDKDGKVVFEQGTDGLGATSRVVDADLSDPGCQRVDIRRADYLVQSDVVDVPNVVKIDVEGFELEVLSGMKQTLANRALKAVGIEVHFKLLQERGLTRAPRQMESLLQEAGFLCSWPDSSHIFAIRTS